MASSTIVPAASLSQTWKYDVFLSFRGEDTRKNFVDHLYSELVGRLVHTYKDDITLPRGDAIVPTLMNAIEESRIAIIIFSKKYADSSFCLDELAFIMKCRDERGQIVLPIFYHVDPSDVDNQTGEFGKAFEKAKLEIADPIKAESWRKAIVDACGISGWEPKNVANGHESDVIKQIADAVLDRLFYLKPDVHTNIVGMVTRAQLLESQLKIGSGGVRMLGIWGVGGGGKTTLASCVYNAISHHFHGCIFLDEIREESRKHGIKYLQEKVLKSLLKAQVVVQSVEDGKHKLKQRLCQRKVLVVLDDVDHVDQLEALAGKHDWFGEGSRIIITTRDQHLLTTHKVDEVYGVSLLSEDEAIQLFRYYAYQDDNPVEDYETLSLRVVSYANGLPLALKVLGKFLYDKDKHEWMSTLAKLGEIPEMEILEKLKISYNGLKPEDKELFLDIACFFRGKYVDSSMKILEACRIQPIIGVKVLTQKALITISDGKFDMHNLLQEMGHYIVQGEHPDNPEEHSRLWQTRLIDNLCSRVARKEYNKVKAIVYDGHSSCFPRLVSNLKKLRLLYVTSLNYNDPEVEGPDFLSDDLRYISWPNYPASSLPENFHPTKLFGLHLYGSLQQEVWQGYKCLSYLKKLHLLWLKNLIRTPDFDGLPCLEELSIYKCSSLEEIHPSLGNHTSLEEVIVSGCDKLKIFPTITRMEKLETLEIRDCPVLHKFPEIEAKEMDRLVRLSLYSVGIEVLPSSIGQRCKRLISLKLVSCRDLKSIEGNFHALKNLKELELNGCPQLKKLPKTFLFDEKCCLENLCCSLMTNTKISTMTWFFFGFHHMQNCLRKLDLSFCKLKDGEIPFIFGELYRIQELDLSNNEFSRLHFSLSRLTQLKLFILTGCKNLVELPELPSNVEILKADRCLSLASVGDGHTNCKWLSQVFLQGSHADGVNRLLRSMLQGDAVEYHSLSLQVDGVEIPRMFTPLLSGERFTLQLPQNWCNEYCGFLMCIVLTSVSYDPLHITMEHGTCTPGVPKDSFDNSDVATSIGYVPFASLKHTTWWDPKSNLVSFSVHLTELDSLLDKQCSGFGVRLVPKKRARGLMEITTDSYEYDGGYGHKYEITHDSRSILQICL